MEKSWVSLASDLLLPIRSGQPLAMLHALGSSRRLSRCLPCGDTSVRVFNRTTQREINFLGELVVKRMGVMTPTLDFFISAFDPYFLPGRILLEHSISPSVRACVCACVRVRAPESFSHTPHAGLDPRTLAS